MENEQTFEMSIALGNEILAYLGTQPYSQVAQLIQRIADSSKKEETNEPSTT